MNQLYFGIPQRRRRRRFDVCVCVCVCVCSKISPPAALWVGLLTPKHMCSNLPPADDTQETHIKGLHINSFMMFLSQSGCTHFQRLPPTLFKGTHFKFCFAISNRKYAPTHFEKQGPTHFKKPTHLAVNMDLDKKRTYTFPNSEKLTLKKCTYEAPPHWGT